MTVHDNLSLQNSLIDARRTIAIIKGQGIVPPRLADRALQSLTDLLFELHLALPHQGDSPLTERGQST